MPSEGIFIVCLLVPQLSNIDNQINNKLVMEEAV